MTRRLRFIRLGALLGLDLNSSPQDPYTGVDLDKCRDPETGEIEPWARSIIDRLKSYTEISPSGCGLHILIRPSSAPGGNRKGKLEFYDRGRYFTMTGHHLVGTPATIESRQGSLRGLHLETFGKPPSLCHAPAPKSGTSSPWPRGIVRFGDY